MSAAAAGIGMPIHLNSTQIHLVRKSWTTFRCPRFMEITISGSWIDSWITIVSQFFESKGKHEPGLTILTHSFALKNEIRPLFEMGDEAGKYQNYHRRLKEHAVKLNEMLELVVLNLDTGVCVEENLKVPLPDWRGVTHGPCTQEIGCNHVHLREFGFKHAYWDAFAKSLLDYLIGNGNTFAFRRKRETQIAWTEIVMYVTGRLKDGYNQEIRRRKKEFRIREQSSSFDSRSSWQTDECPMEAISMHPLSLCDADGGLRSSAPHDARALSARSSLASSAASSVSPALSPMDPRSFDFHAVQHQGVAAWAGRVSQSQPGSRIPSLDSANPPQSAAPSNFLSPYATDGRRSPKLGQCGPLSKSFDERRRVDDHSQLMPPDSFITRALSPNRRRPSQRMLESMGFSRSFDAPEGVNYSDVESPSSPYSRSSGASSSMYPGNPLPSPLPSPPPPPFPPGTHPTRKSDSRWAAGVDATPSRSTGTRGTSLTRPPCRGPRTKPRRTPLSHRAGDEGAVDLRSYHHTGRAQLPEPPGQPQHSQLQGLDSGYAEPDAHRRRRSSRQLHKFPSIQVNDLAPNQDAVDSARYRFKCNYQMSLDLPKQDDDESEFILEVQAPTPVDTPRGGFWDSARAHATHLAVPTHSGVQRRSSTGGGSPRLRPQASVDLHDPAAMRGPRRGLLHEKSASFSFEPEEDDLGRRHYSDSALYHHFN